MNETLLWLLYCVSGAVAFAIVYFLRVRILFAVVEGGLITGAGWALLYYLTDEEKRPNWIRVDLCLNLTFGLMFAAAGAVLGSWLVARRESAD